MLVPQEGLCPIELLTYIITYLETVDFFTYSCPAKTDGNNNIISITNSYVIYIIKFVFAISFLPSLLSVFIACRP
jgi:hypothetical protein